MSERPLTESDRTESYGDHAEADPIDSAPEQPQPYPSSSKSSPVLTYVALLIAVIAVALAALAYFLPAHKSASSAAAEPQGGDAKANVCAAYKTIHQGVVINTHLESPEPVGQLAVAANARLALIGGGAYLRERVAANPGAPDDLTKALNSMANTIEQLGVNYLAGASNIVQDPLRHDLDNEINQIEPMCAA